MLQGSCSARLASNSVVLMTYIVIEVTCNVLSHIKTIISLREPKPRPSTWIYVQCTLSTLNLRVSVQISPIRYARPPLTQISICRPCAAKAPTTDSRWSSRCFHFYHKKSKCLWKINIPRCLRLMYINLHQMHVIREALKNCFFLGIIPPPPLP